MPVQFKQVISSFLTQSAYKKIAVSAAWHIFPGFEVLMLSSFHLLFSLACCIYSFILVIFFINVDNVPVLYRVTYEPHILPLLPTTLFLTVKCSVSQIFVNWELLKKKSLFLRNALQIYLSSRIHQARIGVHLKLEYLQIWRIIKILKISVNLM
jgi:hypothetical protein